MSNENLQIWNEVSKTDTSATKESSHGGRKQTSIDGYWLIKRATEMFGPLGIGWGYEILEDRWDEGAPFNAAKDGEEPRIVISKTHTAKVKLWYKLGDQRGELIQYGHTQAVYKSKWGATDDSEAPKKSLMDAIKKSLSMLGFSADVFMGQFDNNEYREQLQAEEAIEKAESRDAEIEAKRKELSEYVTSHLELIKTSRTAHEVKAITRAALRHLEYQKNIRALAEIADRGSKAIARDSEAKLKEWEKAA